MGLSGEVLFAGDRCVRVSDVLNPESVLQPGNIITLKGHSPEKKIVRLSLLTKVWVSQHILIFLNLN
jgi:hypothetical protein